MAFMNQERKQAIAANLKNVMPKGWKYSLGVRHHSTIVLTVHSANIDLLGEYIARQKAKHNEFVSDTTTNITVNPYWLDRAFEGERLEQIKAIFGVLNNGNHDRSDSQTDYFDVGWYSEIKIGKWDKPFQVTA